MKQIKQISYKGRSPTLTNDPTQLNNRYQNTN